MKVVDDMGADVAVGDVGEIAIRGHNIMKGYWRKPDKTAAAIRDGWFRTGDVRASTRTATSSCRRQEGHHCAAIRMDRAMLSELDEPIGRSRSSDSPAARLAMFATFRGYQRT